MSYEVVDSDVLVIGAGGAGVRAAIEAARKNVQAAVVTKELFGKAHTIMAEGGYNAALANVDSSDNWMWHFYDTVVGGAWINNQELVEVLVKEAPDRIYDLEEFGSLLDRTTDGRIAQRAFGKQTYRRTCYSGDRTGHELMATLVEECRRLDIEVFDEVFSTRLIVDDGRIAGVTAIDIKTGVFKVFRAKAVVLASGGAGRIYEITTNAQADTGDGFAMALYAGAELVDMEMVQFHPTGMVYPESCKGILVTEAVRGEGGILYNIHRERFMKRYAPEKMELAGRDEVARAIAREVLEGRGTPRGGVYLDVSHLAAELIEERLPSMLEQFEKVGVDIRKEPMEVAPTGHHMMGGLEINEKAESNIVGLFGAGEVTGGIHGGNRLGGNALADTQVFGKRAGENAALRANRVSRPRIDRDFVESEAERVYGTLDRDDGVGPREIMRNLKQLMWGKVGIFRSGAELREASSTLTKWRLQVLPRFHLKSKCRRYNREWIEALELENMIITAEIVAKAALLRQESRGAHFRVDFPKPDNENWFVNIVVKKQGDDIGLRKEPVITTYIKFPGASFKKVKWQ